MPKPNKTLFLALALIQTIAIANEQNSLLSNQFSKIDYDERVVFFKTHSWLDEHSQNWMIPIHGWVYEPQDSKLRKASFAKILAQKYDLLETPATQENFSRRVNLMLADNERGKEIVIKLADKSYRLPRSKANGHFKTTLAVPVDTLSKSAAESVKFSVQLPIDDTRSFEGESILLSNKGLSIISDIDDTVKISYVTQRKELLKATFFDDFKAVEDMSKLYRQWRAKGASLHFVSSSPWQLHEPLEKFLIGNAFPSASMSLKDIRFRDETLLNLFKSGTETKPTAIRNIIDNYPKRRFILVGDSGEQDPEVYAQIAQEYPDQIEKIFIRNIDETPQDARYQSVFGDVDEIKWQLFRSASELIDAI